MRIVTLLPSATEIVAALGAESDLVGISHSCDYPSTIANLPQVTSTTLPVSASSAAIDAAVREELSSEQSLYQLDIATLAALRPDVIVSQRLCDVCAVATGHVVEALAQLPTKPMLVDLSPMRLADIFADVHAVGRAIGRESEAAQLVASMEQRMMSVAVRTEEIAPSLRPAVGFLEWLDPPFSGGHWNPELIEIAGGRSVLGAPGEPSQTLTWDDVAAADPQVLFVAVCGYDERRAQVDVAALARTEPWSSLQAVRSGRVYVANGDAYFARPGPRVIDGLDYLAHTLHPSIHAVTALA
ncbi:MAG: cobalamin-binding protein [Pseudomonadota bacterium]